MWWRRTSWRANARRRSIASAKYHQAATFKELRLWNDMIFVDLPQHRLCVPKFLSLQRGYYLFPLRNVQEFGPPNVTSRSSILPTALSGVRTFGVGCT